MRNLKYLEIAYYKIVIDLLQTLLKYNFEPENINLKINNFDTGRIENIRFSNIDSLLKYYKNNAELKNSIDCAFGNNIYLDSINFNSLLYNSEIKFKVINVSKEYSIRKNHLEKLNLYNERFTENQKRTLSKLLYSYTKIYGYIVGTRQGSSGDYYSACYAEPLWANDILAKNNYETILKYNLFDLKTQNIPNVDKEIINKILLY